ncbi:MAG: GSCFA domain-containing protein [Bacteroidia bacterium]
MKFHLNYNPAPSDFKINHKSKLFLIGSCFSENIGNLLSSNKFHSHSNPNGILFNPASIALALQNTITGENFDEEYSIERDGIFYSLLHHSSIHASSKKELADKINSLNKSAADFLKTSDLLIITFGTAFIYRHILLNKTVANCHKLPGAQFNKKLLQVEQVTKNYSTLIHQLQLFNPTLKIIFTVSPVKYLKDGLVENNLSKSVLLLSVHELVKRFANCSYFPAFELVNDDLRDYRFYKEDLAHPNEQAIDYVWRKFSDCYFNDETKALNTKINKLNLALQHKRMNENSQEVKKLEEFIEKQKEEIRKLNPVIQF